MLNLNWNIIWTFINLIILYLLLRKFLFGPITAMMERRKSLIQDSLDEAKKANQEVAALRNSYITKLDKAEDTAKDIVKEARKSANIERDKILTKAKDDANNLLKDANHQIEIEKERTYRNVQSEIATIAMDAAVKATEAGDISRDLFDSFIDEVGGVK